MWKCGERGERLKKERCRKKTDKISFTNTAYKTMINSVKIAQEKEIGGVLIGKKNEKEWSVTHCITDHTEKKGTKTSIVVSTKKMYKELT